MMSDKKTVCFKGALMQIRKGKVTLPVNVYKRFSPSATTKCLSADRTNWSSKLIKQGEYKAGAPLKHRDFARLMLCNILADKDVKINRKFRALIKQTATTERKDIGLFEWRLENYKFTVKKPRK